MVLMKSTSILERIPLEGVSLIDTNRKTVFLTDLLGDKATVIIFTCNHCPYAIELWPRLLTFYQEYSPKGVQIIAINPNIHPDYPEDSVEQMKVAIKQMPIPFPYLADEDQSVSRLFEAQCTPDITLLDGQQRPFYRGQFDDCWHDISQVKEHSLALAVDQILEGKTSFTGKMHPSMGCSIKWLSN